MDAVIQGLCAFLLGILYEYNRDKSAIDRQTMHPILHTRVGPDQFVNKIARLREDNRFKNVGPDILEMSDDNPETQYLHEDGFWFDWPFVEFVRNNYRTLSPASSVIYKSVFMDNLDSVCAKSDTARSRFL